MLSDGWMSVFCMLLVPARLTSPPPPPAVTPWSCAALPVISGMSLPAQERTGLNVALSWSGPVSHREALFHYSPPDPPVCGRTTCEAFS